MPFHFRKCFRSIYIDGEAADPVDNGGRPGGGEGLRQRREARDPHESGGREGEVRWRPTTEHGPGRGDGEDGDDGRGGQDDPQY